MAMRYAPVIFILFQLLSCEPVSAQIGSTDSSPDVRIEYKSWQDSINREKLLMHLGKNSQSLDAFLSDMKERERKQERRMQLRIGLGATFLLVLILVLARRRKKAERAG